MPVPFGAINFHWTTSLFQHTSLRCFGCFYFIIIICLLQWLIAETSNISHSDVRDFFAFPFLSFWVMESICGLHQIKKVCLSLGSSRLLSWCFFLFECKKIFVMFSKYTFPACPELSWVAYLLINSDKKTKHRTFVLFIYLFIGTSGRSSVKCWTKTENNKKKCCAKLHLTWRRKRTELTRKSPKFHSRIVSFQLTRALVLVALNNRSNGHAVPQKKTD